MKEEIKNLNTRTVHRRFSLFVKQSYPTFWSEKAVKTKNGRIMLLSKCEVCKITTSRFIKGQEASGLLKSLGIKVLLSRNPIAGPFLF